MRLHKKVVPNIARDIVTALVDNGDIEVGEETIRAAEQDFEAILAEYQRRESELHEFARELLVSRGWSASRYSEARRLAAANRKLPIDDDGLDYVINQMLEFMMISKNIDEVFAEDHVMRKRIADVIRGYLKLDQEVDEEVRKRLKNLEEGTRDWEVAYRKTLEEVRRAKGIA